MYILQKENCLQILGFYENQDEVERLKFIRDATYEPAQ
jgi:hypothetical protein